MWGLSRDHDSKRTTMSAQSKVILQSERSPSSGSPGKPSRTSWDGFDDSARDKLSAMSPARNNDQPGGATPKPLPVTVYTPDSSLASPAKMLRDMWRDLLASRELAWRLAVRDISAQYRQTFLGILWAFILPLANTLVWVFLSGSGIVAVSDTALPYPVYVFSGSMLWAILMDAVNAPLKQTEAGKSMLAKLNFPRESLIASGIYQTLFSMPLSRSYSCWPCCPSWASDWAGVCCCSPSGCSRSSLSARRSACY